MIKEIEELVESTCKKKTNYFGYGLWKHHIVHVVRFAKQMAKKIGADVEIVEISALLHDYASAKDYALFKEHHIHGARLAEKLLKKYKYPKDKIEKIKHCILSHSGEENRIVQRESKEAQCVADADTMAHFASTSSLFYLAFFSHKYDIDEAEKWLMAKLERGWKKLSPEAKEIVRDKYNGAKALFSGQN